MAGASEDLHLKQPVLGVYVAVCTCEVSDVTAEQVRDSLRVSHDVDRAHEPCELGDAVGLRE